MRCNQDTDVLQNFRRVRRSQIVGSCRRVVFVIPSEPVDLLLLTHVFEESFLVLMFFERLNQLCDLILSPRILQFRR